jgi:hypothetical protein
MAEVPLGRLESEPMVPLDDDILDLIDHITAIRSPGQPLPHPDTGARHNVCSPTTAGVCHRTPSAPNWNGPPTPPASDIRLPTSSATRPPHWSTPECHCNP